MHLALRHKITIAFMVLLVGSLVFVGIAYHRHSVIRQKLKFIEQADDLHNNVLEARRYEKNLFLYGGQENLKELLHFLTLAEKQIERFQREGLTETKTEEWQRSQVIIAYYRQKILQNVEGKEAPVAKRDIQQSKELSKDLRDYGRNLTGIIEAAVAAERQRVDQLVSNQKRSLLYSFGAFVALILVLTYYFYNLIFRPLSAIQSAASEITAGNVQKIPPLSRSPEIQSLISVLNLMIKELDKKSEQLIQQEKMAALGTLTSGVAHELNNPLSNISSSTQILLEEIAETDPDFQRQLLNGIEQQVEKAREIVRSLLEYSREREFEPKPTDMRTLVENTVKLVQGEVPPEVGIKVEIPYPIEVEVDQRRLSQALMNLMLNGIQAMDGSSGILNVGAYYHPRSEKVSLEVSDEGIGIPAENLAKIFDPFFSTKEVGEGTGMGLYVTYGIVQKHHGKISVTSEPGRGTKFVITLPVKQPREEDDK